MSKQAYLKRYSLILEKIESGKFPTFKDLQAHLQKNDLALSTRTLQRDIEQLRVEFGLEIGYDMKEKGYCLKDSLFALKPFFRLLHTANTFDFLLNSLQESKEVLQSIDFDASITFQNIHFLPDFLQAISACKVLEIKHQSFGKSETRQYTLHPYLLKEYKNRWYLFGFDTQKQDFRLLGIDRIREYQITTEIFTKQAINPKDFFKDVIGLNYSENPKLERFVLSFIPKQGNYLRTLPLHPSQVILRDTELEFRISLEIRYNYEFLKEILSYSGDVRVLEPEWFVKEVREMHENAFKKYL